VRHEVIDPRCRAAGAGDVTELLGGREIPVAGDLDDFVARRPAGW